MTNEVTVIADTGIFSVGADVLAEVGRTEECLVYPRSGSIIRRGNAIGEVVRAFKVGRQVHFTYKLLPNCKKPDSLYVKMFAATLPVDLPWYKRWVNKLWSKAFPSEKVISVNGIYHA